VRDYLDPERVDAIRKLVEDFWPLQADLNAYSLVNGSILSYLDSDYREESHWVRSQF
jgi:hypothetical protein